MFNFPKLNLYDTEAVKTFIYDILVENRQLRTAVEGADARADMWYKDYTTQKDRADKADGQVEHLKSVTEALATERDAIKASAGASSDALNTIVDEAFKALEQMGLPTETNNALAFFFHSVRDVAGNLKGGGQE